MAHYRGQPGCPVIPTHEKRTVRMTSWRGTGACRVAPAAPRSQHAGTRSPAPGGLPTTSRSTPPRTAAAGAATSPSSLSSPSVPFARSTRRDQVCKDGPSQLPSLGNARRFRRSNFGTRRRRKGRHFLQRLPAKRLAQLRQAPAFPVRQSEPVLAEPLPQRRVLSTLVLDHPRLVLSHPHPDPCRQELQGAGAASSPPSLSLPCAPFGPSTRHDHVCKVGPSQPPSPGNARRFSRSSFGTRRDLQCDHVASRTVTPRRPTARRRLML